MNWEARREEEGVEQAFLEELYEAKKSEESDRLCYVGTRKSSLTPLDVAFSKKTVKTCLARGIPLARVDAKTPLRQYLQETSGLKLSNRSDLGAYIPELMEEEEKILANELEGVNLSAIYDATPRQGDFFAMLARFVHADEKLRRATARHRLMHIASLEGSLNAASLSAEVSCGLRKNNVPHASVPAAIVDRCSILIAQVSSL